MATKTEEGFAATVVSWPDKVKGFLNDVRTEMRKVTTPSAKEVRATTVVVIITVFIFALYFAVIDYVLGFGVEKLLHWARSL